MVIQLSSDLEAALMQMALRHGTTPEGLAVRLLQSQLAELAAAKEAADPWVQRLRSVASNCGVSLSDAAVSSEGIYQ